MTNDILQKTSLIAKNIAALKSRDAKKRQAHILCVALVAILKAGK